MSKSANEGNNPSIGGDKEGEHGDIHQRESGSENSSHHDELEVDTKNALQVDRLQDFVYIILAR